jgi:hypothetical protein
MGQRKTSEPTFHQALNMEGSLQEFIRQTTKRIATLVPHHHHLL